MEVTFKSTCLKCWINFMHDTNTCTLLGIKLLLNVHVNLTQPALNVNLLQFYSAIIESLFCTSITVWFSSATKSDLRRLRRVVRTAERTIGITLPTLQELYLSRMSKRAGKITLDPLHPAHSLFELQHCTKRAVNWIKLAGSAP